MNRLLFLFLIGVLGISACTCDEGYCPDSDFIDFGVEFTNDFRLKDLDTMRVNIYDARDNSLIRSYQPLTGNSSALFITREVYFNYEFYSNGRDLREQYYIIKTAETSDTLKKFYFDTNNTTYECTLGCFPTRSRSEKNYTEISNFYFLHNQDTIWDNYVLIEK